MTDVLLLNLWNILSPWGKDSLIPPSRVIWDAHTILLTICSPIASDAAQRHATRNCQQLVATRGDELLGCFPPVLCLTIFVSDPHLLNEMKEFI